MCLHSKTICFIFSLLFTITYTLSSCKKDQCDDNPNPNPCDTCIIAYKPNIYLYPEETTEVKVEIKFPRGGKVIESIPSYEEGWRVSISPNGKINNKWNYLFYESTQPNQWQKETGWTITQENLQPFFIKNMKAYGFSKPEIIDFITHWVPRLKNGKSYYIYPQTNKEIDLLISLHISNKPEKIMRLFYLIEPQNGIVEKLKSPAPPTEFVRNGYYATEWGVLMNIK